MKPWSRTAALLLPLLLSTVTEVAAIDVVLVCLFISLSYAA